MKFSSVLVLTVAGLASANFIPNYRRDAHGPDGDAPKGAPTPMPKPPAQLAQRFVEELIARSPQIPSGPPKPPGPGAPKPGTPPPGVPKPGPPKGPPGGPPKPPSMRVRQTAPKPSGAMAGMPGMPGMAAPPKPSGAAGGMAGMSHGGMRARSPQGFPKPSGAPKPPGVPGGGAPVAGGMPPMPKAGGGGHSHGGT